MKTYLLAFLIAAPIVGVLVHLITKEPMPWWPDTAIVGAMGGVFAMLLVLQRRLDRRGARHLRNIWRLARGKSAVRY